MKVECEVRYEDLPNDRGGTTPGVIVDCGRCEGHQKSFGTGSSSVKRCLVLLRENCPMSENNFYTTEESED